MTPDPSKNHLITQKKYTVLKSGRTEVLLDTQDQLSRLALVQTPQVPTMFYLKRQGINLTPRAP